MDGKEKGREKRRKETNDKYVFIESVNRVAESRRDEHSPRILLDTKGAAYKCVACLHSDMARPRLDDGMASANVGESKVTREKKRREEKVGKRRTAAAAAAVVLNSARLMGDASLASSATQLPVSRVKERGRTRTSNDEEALARLMKACKSGEARTLVSSTATPTHRTRDGAKRYVDEDEEHARASNLQ